MLLRVRSLSITLCGIPKQRICELRDDIKGKSLVDTNALSFNIIIAQSAAKNPHPSLSCLFGLRGGFLLLFAIAEFTG